MTSYLIIATILKIEMSDRVHNPPGVVVEPARLDLKSMCKQLAGFVSGLSATNESYQYSSG